MWARKNPRKRTHERVVSCVQAREPSVEHQLGLSEQEKMARAANAGRGKGGGDGGRAGRGRGGRGRGTSGTIPRKASEVGACKELEGHIFTIGSGNKGKDGDMMRTTIEKMATYIGTKFGDDAAQEWVSNKKNILPEPTYLLPIHPRQACSESESHQGQDQAQTQRDGL